MKRTFRLRLLASSLWLLSLLQLRAATFDLSTAGIQEIQAAVDAGALTYEKLVRLYLARIEAYDQKGPALNTIITLNPKIIDEARNGGLLVIKCGVYRNVLRFLPPLVTQESQIDEALDILEAALARALN